MVIPSAIMEIIAFSALDCHSRSSSKYLYAKLYLYKKMSVKMFIFKQSIEVYFKNKINQSKNCLGICSLRDGKCQNNKYPRRN